MSKYTTQVRYICERACGYNESQPLENVNYIIQNSWNSIFGENWPIFDENYREKLCSKILQHYYTYEIGSETVGLWKLQLQTRMNEIMPYYNQLYLSELIDFEPLTDVDLTTNHGGHKNETTNTTDNDTGTRTGSTTGNSDTTTHREGTDNSNTSNIGSSEGKTTSTTTDQGDKWDEYSDTPMGGLSGVQSLTYLTNARHISDQASGSKTDNATTSTNGTTTVSGSNSEDGNSNTVETTSSTEKTTNDRTRHTSLNGTDGYTQTMKGKNGGKSYSELLMEYRKTFLNIDMKIIDELKDLFMGLW